VLLTHLAPSCIVLHCPPLPQELTKWNTLLRTTTFIFERLENIHDMFWRSLNLRETARSLYKACVRTAFQRIIEITMYRQSEEKAKGKRTHAQIANDYQKRLTLSSGSEKITENLVAQVHSIYTKSFNHPDTMAVVQDAERRVYCSALRSDPLLAFMPEVDKHSASPRKPL